MSTPRSRHSSAQAVKVLEELGATVEEKDPGFADPAPCFRMLWWAGARALLGKLPADKKKLLDPALADVVEQSKSITLDDYQDAVRERGLARQPDAPVHGRL